MDKNTYKKIYSEFHQYKADMFHKLGIDFKVGQSLLDVGCGDCTDSQIFRNIFGLQVLATDIYKNKNAEIWNIPFELLSIYEIDTLNKKFDYVFLHDVLHHIDEEHQSIENHTKALQALKKVIKPGGSLIIIEGNRYNPIFLPHMVMLRGHEHFTQEYFRNLIRNVFPIAQFKTFEAHAYPTMFLGAFKIYEKIMESVVPEAFLSYNAAVVDNYEEQ